MVVYPSTVKMVIHMTSKTIAFFEYLTELETYRRSIIQQMFDESMIEPEGSERLRRLYNILADLNDEILWIKEQVSLTSPTDVAARESNSEDR